MSQIDQQKIRKMRFLLQNPYAFVNGDGAIEAILGDQESEAEVAALSRYQSHDPYAGLNGEGAIETAQSIEAKKDAVESKGKLRSRGPVNQLAPTRVEQEVAELKRRVWDAREDCWPNGVPYDLTEVLDPEVALNLIGYELEFQETLGEYKINGRQVEVAGVLDRLHKKVSISRRFNPTIQRFTIAHELGHAVMHDSIRMHRDRALDGSLENKSRRDQIEWEADKFATHWLMPEKLVKERFKSLFLCDQFEVNENTRFALGAQEADKLKYVKSTRDLTRLLANAQSFNGRTFYSLAHQFKVSTEAMAIRIEELQLV